MLEITGNEVKELSDIDLRSLVGLLCEADLRESGLPTAGITWGGHQNAKDGGVDVRVELLNAPHPDGYIPRAVVGFQVKKPDMPRSEVLKEMCPDGELRQAIKDLADVCGAYIIVSSRGSTADGALTDRKNAMREALSGLDNASNLKVDFYDRERVAGWVRSHPSLILWVREKIGNPIQGWQPYGNWSKAPGGVEEEYLLDEDVRVRNESELNKESVTAIDGINYLRTALSRPASSVRLTGLSGVGKTRFLQALFDERIGNNSLNKSQVCYTDISDSPSPDPRNFAERIIAMQKPAILAIDNCPPDLHRRLTSVCAASGSMVSLITVEYDVREDQPEETKVFRLEPSSIDLVEKIILNRFSQVSQVDARTIAEFSGGNARIAISLANTIKKGETLADLKDESLFERLFIQRNESNNTLLRTAEACSLVYSFDAQTSEGKDKELEILGNLAGRTVGELYADIVELNRRELIQQRGIWRAVLPHALSNKLAHRALDNIPIDTMLGVFVSQGAERLLKSFSRRLSYLHESKTAKEIAETWLSEHGLLGDISNLNELGIAILLNISPIVPERVLEKITRVSDIEKMEASLLFSDNRHYRNFTQTICSIAYDGELFVQSAKLLSRLSLSGGGGDNNNVAREALQSLFYLYLSGTHASIIQRFNFIKNLVRSNKESEKELGVLLLKSALEAWHFSAHHHFDFGARSRDFGYQPKTRDDIRKWFGGFIGLAKDLAISDDPIAQNAKTILADKLRGLWIKACVFDEIEDAVLSIVEHTTWNEGWIAVRTTIRFDSKRMEPDIVERLLKLEEILSPTNLLEQARVYALTSQRHALDLADAENDSDEKASDSYLRVEKKTRDLGRSISKNEKVLMEILPELVCVNGSRLFSFGQGLADGCADISVMWGKFHNQIASMNQGELNYRVLLGFLCSAAERDINATEIILDDSVKDKVFSNIFPVLQSSVEINEQGVGRLKQSLEYGAAPIGTYNYLAYGRADSNINDKNITDLLRIISSKPGGVDIAIDILHMRLNRGKCEENIITEDILSIGQELAANIKFSSEHKHLQNLDYELSEIVKLCFNQENAKENSKKLCENLVEALATYTIYAMDYRGVIKSIAITQPYIFLENFVRDDAIHNRQNHGIFAQDIEREINPLSIIDDNLIIDWCEEDPITRYKAIASCITPYRNNEKEDALEWTALSLKVIDNASDPIDVLNNLKNSFRPMSWSGSRANILQQRLPLISVLKNHENPTISEWACDQEIAFKEEISSERKWESKTEANRNECFE